MNKKLLLCLLSTCLLLLCGCAEDMTGRPYSEIEAFIAENPNMPAMEALRLSEQMMNGRKLDYFVLNLSFLGWALLAIPTLGLITIWLEPYMQMTMVNFYSDVKSNYSQFFYAPPPPPPPFGEQV